MPTFAYTARDESGTALSGTLVAETIAEVQKSLRSEGKYPTSVRPVDEAAAEAADAVAAAGIRISRNDVIHFASQLAIMVETGVTLSEALDSISTQCDKPAVKRLVDDLSRYVHNGGDFSSALMRHPRSFPRLFIAVVRASEKSGLMAKLLLRATAYLKDERDMIRRVRGAMIYPLIMLSFAVMTTAFLLMWVFPRFSAIYQHKKAVLPLPTRMLMELSTELVTNAPLLAAIGITTILVLSLLLRTQSGCRMWHYVQLNIPLLGALCRKLYLARSLRMLGTMAGAGVNLVDAVKTSQELCSNSYFRDLWGQVGEQIQAGRQLSEPLFQSPLVPRTVAQMIHSGEKIGRLAQVMEQVSAYSEEELKEQMALLTRFIEPAMVVIMGLIVGGISLAMLLPIFNFSRIMAN